MLGLVSTSISLQCSTLVKDYLPQLWDLVSGNVSFFFKICAFQAMRAIFMSILRNTINLGRKLLKEEK